MIGVLGAGPHGQQVAEIYGPATLYDDSLPGFEPTVIGAGRGLFVIGAVWPRVRREIAGRVNVAGLAYRRLENGLVQFPGVKIGRDVYIGQHTHLLYDAVVQHGCRVGSFVTICAGAVLGGEVTVEDDVFIGANATVIHGGLTIGRGATVGAGAVVIHDVPAGATVVGNPAQQVRT